MNIRLLTYTSTAALLLACSSTANLDHVGMCKALVEEARGGVTFDSANADGAGYEDLVVKLGYTDANGSKGSASCYYENTVQDAGPDELIDPLSAYATSPHRMMLDGKVLVHQQLANLTNGVMVRAGKELAAGAEHAAKNAGEIAEGAARKAAEAAKKAAEGVSKTLNEPAI